MMAVQPHALRRPFRARSVYRVLYKRLRLPRPLVHGLLSGAKRLAVASQVARRRMLARNVGPDPAMALDETTAAQRFAPADLPGAAETAARCVELYRDYRANARDRDALARNPNKRFLLSVLAGDEFAAHPQLLRFMVSRPLLDAATRYLGTVPVVEGAALWWTPPNDTVRASQAWHIDELAARQVKMLLNCLPVDADNGPVHFLPAALSERLRAETGHRRGRFDDSRVEATGVADKVQASTGPAGSGVLLDSSRCLHYGSRGNRADRLVLTFHYLPIEAPTETRYRLQLERLPEVLADLDERQRLALGFG